MDQPHLSAQLQYLEQQHQSDQVKIAQLQQQIETQAYDLQEQSKKIQQMETALNDTQATSARVPQLEEQLTNLKNELLQLIEHRSERREQITPYSNQALVTQLESHTKVLNELRRELDSVHRADDTLLLARTEIERLNMTVNTFEARLQGLGKQVEEETRLTSYREEQRRTDTQRLADLQNELPKLQEKLGSSLSKIQAVEQQIPQFSKFELALEDVREEIRRHREHLDFQMAQRERLLKNWTDLAEEQERRAKEHEKLMDKYMEHYQLNKRALASLQDFQERLQREQHQAEELQRLAENRQRATVEKLQTDYEQRWQKQGLEWQPRLENLQKDVAQIKNQLAQINKSNQMIDDQIIMILQIIEEDIQSRANANQEWQHRFQELASGQP